MKGLPLLYRQVNLVSGGYSNERDRAPILLSSASGEAKFSGLTEFPVGLLQDPK